MPTDGGTWEKHSFDGHFARLGQERVEYIIQNYERRIADIKSGIELTVELEVLTPKAIASEILIGWDGITSEDQEVPYTEATKNRLLEVETVAASIILAWSRSLQGNAAKKPTSKKPRGIG